MIALPCLHQFSLWILPSKKSKIPFLLIFFFAAWILKTLEISESRASIASQGAFHKFAGALKLRRIFLSFWPANIEKGQC